jgi:hypothetical protein
VPPLYAPNQVNWTSLTGCSGLTTKEDTSRLKEASSNLNAKNPLRMAQMSPEAATKAPNRESAGPDHGFRDLELPRFPGQARYAARYPTAGFGGASIPNPRPRGDGPPQLVVDRHLELLLATQVALGRLDRGMPQQELDLLECSAREPA